MSALKRLPDHLLFVHVAVMLAVCVLMVVYISLPLRNLLESMTANTIIIIAFYGLAAYAFYAACLVPLYYYYQSGFLLRQRLIAAYGRGENTDEREKKRLFARFVITLQGVYLLVQKEGKTLVQDFFEWGKRYAREQAAAALRFMIALQGVYLLVQTREFWWIWLALLVIGGTVLRQLSVSWLIPGLMKWPEVEDEALRSRLISLVERFGIRPQTVCVSTLGRDSILANGARLIRVGNRIRIVLHPAVKDYSHAEAEVLLARDLGRYYFHLAGKRYVAEALGVAALCALAGICFAPLARWMQFYPITDIATAPILVGLFITFGVPLRMVRNAWLARVESYLDGFALQLTRAADALVSVFVRLLAASETADDASPRPALWLRSAEPPLAERIVAAQEYDDRLVVRSRWAH